MILILLAVVLFLVLAASVFVRKRQSQGFLNYVGIRAPALAVGTLFLLAVCLGTSRSPAAFRR